MSLPEGLHLDREGNALLVRDAQDVTHIEFVTGAGDPCAWSATIVEATCKALGIDEHWDYTDDDEVPVTLEKIIADWHEDLGAEDGFLP